MSNKNNLQIAKNKKDDEHYTTYQDIENELNFYKNFFKNKKVYLPCDSKESNFYKFFKNNFKELQLDYLVATSFNKDGNGQMVIFDDGTEVSKDLDNNGDFRLQNDLRDFADIIITNPPFSLFTNFMQWCEEKDFIIMGPFNCLAYPYIFNQITNQKMFFGHNVHKTLSFTRPDGSLKEVGCSWFTSFQNKNNNHLKLKTKAENEAAGVVYKKFDNKDIINVSRVNQIPSDYKDQMGVPITFLEKWNPDDYEILGRRYGDDGKDLKINGKLIYVRTFIRRKNEETN